MTGPVDTLEEVVVDFGTIKREIKELIDGRKGYDHKLWVLPDVGDESDMSSWYTSGPSSSKLVAKFNIAGRTTVATPKIAIRCPENAVKVCQYDSIPNLEKDIEAFLETNLNAEGNRNITVKVRLHTNPVLPYDRIMSDKMISWSNHINLWQYLINFRYTHGLKNSTSWGCQNIAHGHESWLLFLDGSNNVVPIDLPFKERIDSELHNHTFIWKDNIVFEDPYRIDIEYQTLGRGVFSMTLSKKDCLYQILDTETTVEHLVEWFCYHFKDEVQWMITKGATKVYMSEGLVKGSCFSLKGFMDYE